METFILLTRLISEETNPQFCIQRKERETQDNIRKILPPVRWTHNYAIAGPWDYVDVFQAPDMAAAMKLSALVRHYGGAHTEIWPAMEWNRFEQSLQELAAVMEK